MAELRNGREGSEVEMKFSRLEIFVEEPSMEAALNHIVPKILGDRLDFYIYTFQCKDDLLAHLPERLAGYQRWIPDDLIVLILVDKDREDCKKLKAKIEKIIADKRLRSKTSSPTAFNVVTRIVIEELESWFFGDMAAVRLAYPKVSATVEKKAAYRVPDEIKGGTWEALERVLRNAGYFKSGLRKIELARTVAQHMEPARNNSQSFQLFVQTLEAL